ncbi:MAG: 2Fe-2S iron-sulfur cluster binding domain-containing protein, partial [Lentisphaeraceae bacterium]|nr:2Fe-2S iron-sulfur cluster binding domain-containing protein [Lentisphaeraceae bacterium]
KCLPNVHFITHFETATGATGDPAGKGCVVSVELMRSHLKMDKKDYDFYLCGPPAMMKSVVNDLYYWEISSRRVHWESFGPCAVMWPGDVINSPLKPCLITYNNIGRDEKVTLDWAPQDGTILNLMNESKTASLRMKSDCGQGFCGTCKAKYQGKVFYPKAPAYTQLKKNECLPCVCKPDGDISIDVVEK